MPINLFPYVFASVQSSWCPDPCPSLSNSDSVDAPVDPSSQDQFKKWLNGFRSEDDTLKIDVNTLINETGKHSIMFRREKNMLAHSLYAGTWSSYQTSPATLRPNQGIRRYIEDFGKTLCR